MAHRRIVIDFDDDGEASAADGGDDVLRGTAGLTGATAAATGTQGSAGAGGSKPTDLLRSIQHMRLTLRRLEQQKQQYGAAVAAAPAAGNNSGGVLDKHIALQMQMELLRQDIEQKNSQLQRLPKPGMPRAPTPPVPAEPAASPARSAAAGAAPLARSVSLPSSQRLTGSEAQPPRRQQEQQQQRLPPSKAQQLGRQRSDAGHDAALGELVGDAPPAAVAHHSSARQGAAAAADDAAPAQQPSSQRSPGQRKPGRPASAPVSSVAASAEPSAADELAAARAVAAASVAKAATARAVTASAANAAAAADQEAMPQLGPTDTALGAAAEGAAEVADPSSPLPQPAAPPSSQQPEQGAPAAGHAAAPGEAAEGRPSSRAALLPSGLLQALLPAERRPADDAEHVGIGAQKRQVLLRCRVLQQLLQDATQTWDLLCLQERQQGGRHAHAPPREAAADAARQRRQLQLAALAAAAAERAGCKPSVALLTESAPAGAGPLVVRSAEAEPAGTPAPASAPSPAPAAGATARSSRQEAPEEGQGGAQLHEPRAAAQQGREQEASASRKRGRSRSRSSGEGGRQAAQRQRRLPASASRSSAARTSDSSSSGGTSSGTSSSSGGGTTSSSSSGSGTSSGTSSATSRGAMRRSRGRTQRGPVGRAVARRRSRSRSRGSGRQRGNGVAASRGRPRSRSRDRSLPQQRPPVRRSPTPDAAPPAVAASNGAAARQQAPPIKPTAGPERSGGREDGARKPATASGGRTDGSGGRPSLQVPDSLRRLFLQGLQRCCKLWHLPFSAYRIEGQMERLQRGFVCRRELGAPFAQLLLAMQREGRLRLDMSEASSRWRVTAVPGSAAAADGKVAEPKAAAPPFAARPSGTQAGSAAAAAARSRSAEETVAAGTSAAAAPPAAALQQEQQQQHGPAPAEAAATCAPQAAAPVRFSIRAGSRLSGSKAAPSGAAAAAAPAAAGQGNAAAGGPDAAVQGSGDKPPARQSALSTDGTSGAAPPGAAPPATQPVVFSLTSRTAPWQKLAAAKAAAAAASLAAAAAAAAGAARPAADIREGAAPSAVSQSVGASAAQPVAPCAGVPSPAVAGELQPLAGAEAAASMGVAAPAKAPGAAQPAPQPAAGAQTAVAAVHAGPAGLTTERADPPGPKQQQQQTAPQQAAPAGPEPRSHSNGPVGRSLLAAAAAAAGSVRAAAAANDVVRTSAAFKYAAAEVQQRRQQQGQWSQGGAAPASQSQQAQQAQQARHDGAHKPVRALLLVTRGSVRPGEEHVRLLITPQLGPPLPAAPAPTFPQGSTHGMHGRPSTAPPPAAAPPPSAAPPWSRPAPAPAQHHRQPHQQQRQLQQPLQQQPTGQAQVGQQPAYPAGSPSGRQLSSYADLPPSDTAAGSPASGAGRHLPVFSSTDAGRRRGGPAAGTPPRPAHPRPVAGTPPWLQASAQPAQPHAALLAQLQGCLRAGVGGGCGGSGGLLSVAVAGAVLQRGGSAGSTSGGGLGPFAKLAPLLADWPLCPYELRGSCRDAACRFQMAVDQQAQHAQRAGAPSPQRQAAVAAGGGGARVSPATREATQPPPKRRRVSDATVQAVALEQQLPLYTVGRQWSAGLGGGCGAAATSRGARPFASALLAPAGLLEPTSADATRGVHAALRWLLLPGGGAMNGHVLHSRRQQHQAQEAGGHQQAEAAVPGGSGRYFAGSAAGTTHGQQQDDALAYWQSQYEAVLQQQPEDEELWLSYAVRHAVEAGGDGDDSLPPSVRERMLLVLKRGLEHNRHSAALWPLYLHLYCQQPGCAASMMTDTALQFAPHSYRLWLAAAEQQRQWQEAAAVLQRGVLALCRPAPSAGCDSGGDGAALPEAQAAAALDLGLRLLQLLDTAEQPDSRAQLLQWAAADLSGSDGGLLQRSKAALLAELLPHPRLLAALCCCCAHAAAHGGLPVAAQRCLGYESAPLWELLSEWPHPPGQGQGQHSSEAAAGCRAALLAGADSLGLVDGGGDGGGPLQQERALAPAQRRRVQAVLRHARQAAPEALLVAQSAMLVVALRLDGLAGQAAGPGGSFLAQLAGHSMPALPADSGASLAPAQLAALALTQQRWRAFAAWADGKQRQRQQQRQQQAPELPAVRQAVGQQAGGHRSPAVDQPEEAALVQPPAELVQLLQEAVLAAATAPPSAQPLSSGSSPLLLACLQGQLHPAAAAALAASVAGSDSPGAAAAALRMLGHWALAHEAMNARQAWPWPARPLGALLAASGGRPAAAAATAADEQLHAAAAAALQHLAAAPPREAPPGGPALQPTGPAADAAARLYCCWLAELHSLLAPPPQGDAALQRSSGLPALRAAALAWRSGGQAALQLGEREAAALSLLAAGAARGGATQTAAAVQLALGGAGRRRALLWPPPRQPLERLDPLAAAALAPPAAGASCLPPPPLVRQLPLQLQALLLEAALTMCSPAGAAAAAAVALHAAEAAPASQAADVGAGEAGGEGAPLWRQPLLGWALPTAASALASSIPAADPAVWHQVVALTAAASASAGVELSTAATVVHPYSLRLWQQRQRLLAMRPAGGQQPAVAAQEMQKRGLAPPPPWQHQSAAVWGAPSP